MESMSYNQSEFDFFWKIGFFLFYIGLFRLVNSLPVVALFLRQLLHVRCNSCGPFWSVMEEERCVD